MRQIILVSLYLGCALAAAGTASNAVPADRVMDLRCEYVKDPLGIDVTQPRLSWINVVKRRGDRQTAYELLVASSPELLAQNRGDLWQTGKVASDENVQIAYAGKPLTSRCQCFWKVRVWDQEDQPSAWSDTAFWSMGLLRPDDWQAEWIRANGSLQDGLENAARSEPAVTISPWIRKSFVLDDTPKRSLTHVNALGYCELYVNGQRVGDDVLSPAVSDYRARSFYVTYDVTRHLRKGENCIGLWLGRGWHVAGRPGVEQPGPIVRLQMDIEIGGTTEQVVTDKSWRCTRSPYATLGPWQWDQYGGERYDARLDNPAWSTNGFDDRAWSLVEVASAPGSCAQSQPCPLNRIGERIAAVKCTRLGDGLHEVDFGTNLSGWMRMRMPLLPAGHRLVIHYADRRYATAEPDKLPAGVARHGSDEVFVTADGPVRYQTFHQADEFISAGNPDEEFCSKFNYHGFRYAIVEGLPTAPDIDKTEALLIETDLEPVGSFSCSDERLNRLYRLNLWTLRCLNLGGYLVDCPHRERQGYGDGQVSAETCMMNFWMPNFFTKWLGDWRDGQDLQTGDLPHVAPRDQGGGGPGWGGALAALAWRTYLNYGDRRVLEKNYDAMRRYVDSIESRCTDNVLRAYGGPWDYIGDWVPPERGMDTANWPSAHDNDVFNNCYRIYLWELLEKSATALGRDDESLRCRAKLDQLRPLVHETFHDPNRHTYGAEEQPYQCLPLFVGIVPPTEQDAVLRQLEHNILIRRGGHLDSGMLGTYFLIQHLSAAGRDDLLWTIVNQRTYPGWGYMLDEGATTMWEQWNGYYSQIHSCFTSLAGWFHNGLAGIRPDPAAPGFKKITIRPAVVGDLTWVKCSYRSVRGMIVSNWTHKDGTFTLDVIIPSSVIATVHIPVANSAEVTEGGRPVSEALGVTFLRREQGCAVFEVQSGDYSFAVRLPSP